MKATSTILAAASLMATVHAHGYISQPKATYDSTTEYTKYNALTSASVNKGFSGGKYDDSPENNAKAFNDHWNATGYKSLREMLDPIAPDYGHSLKTATPVDVTGYTEMWWQNDEYKEGFINSHSGPCEAWIDDVKIFHHDNCAAQFKSYPAKVPADYSSCKGDCLLVFYWLALHEPNWQIYKQCVPITNSGSSSTTQSSGKGETAASDAGTEQVTPVAQTETTDAPKAAAATPTPVETTSEATEAPSTEAPEVDTAAPEADTQTEAATPAPEAATPAPEATTATPDTATEAPELATPAPEVTPATPTATEAAKRSGKCVRRRS